MAWHTVEGHDDVVDRFRQAVAHGRLASTYLFVGPAGIGKRKLAFKLAEAILCLNRSPNELEPCGNCESCRLMASGNHPDLEFIAKPEGRSSLPIHLFIGDADHRNREGLCHSISLKPFLGGHKIAIIDDADHFSVESANCLLKTLEEPPPRAILILLGTSLGMQLPTIRSRCQVVRFRPLEENVLADILVREAVVEDHDKALELAPHCQGSIERAKEMVDPELWKLHEQLLRQLAESPLRADILAKLVVDATTAASKEASVRRTRLRTLIGFATEHYRQTLRNATSTADAADQVDQLADSIDHCLDALASIGRNANLTTLTEHWASQLAQTERHAMSESR